MKRTLLLVCVIIGLYTGSVFAEPVTSPFGWRIHPISGVERFHTGADIGYEYGTPVQAMLPGTVVYAREWGGYGNCVILEHAGGDHTLYGHMSRIDVEVGDVVGLHEQIGAIGSTGYSTGPHLHLEWWHNGQYVDPLPLYDMSPEEAYVYTPTKRKRKLKVRRPIRADIMAEEEDVSEQKKIGFGFGLDEEAKQKELLAKLKKERERDEAILREARRQNSMPKDYTAEQMAQMKEAAKQEAVLEAKKQLEAEQKAKRRVFFEFGLK